MFYKMIQNRVKTLYKPFTTRQQSLFHWLNIVFNRVDEDRRREVGPDRTCAEWLLRNGAFVKWNNSPEFLMDYNKLPDDKERVVIVEVEASEASIMHCGFEHFIGCNHIKKIHFHKCYYLENEALKGLAPLKNSLISLKISECLNVTEKGLAHLRVLTKLRELILINLPYVRNTHIVLRQLQNALPHCNINFQ